MTVLHNIYITFSLLAAADISVTICPGLWTLACLGRWSDFSFGAVSQALKPQLLQALADLALSVVCPVG